MIISPLVKPIHILALALVGVSVARIAPDTDIFAVLGVCIGSFTAGVVSVVLSLEDKE